MVKFLAMQARLRKITIEQVLEKYRDAVRELEQDNAELREALDALLMGVTA